jgi:hypothetical protein
LKKVGNYGRFMRAIGHWSRLPFSKRILPERRHGDPDPFDKAKRGDGGDVIAFAANTGCPLRIFPVR